MKSSIRLAVLNGLSVVLVLFVNYYSQTGGINNKTVGELSAKYNTLFTPAGYAFSIWGIIFLSLIAYSVYQIHLAIKVDKPLKEHQQTGYLFALVNLGNASWIIAWLYEFTGLSVIIIVLMLVGLLRIITNTNMERWDAPWKTIAFVWWPICWYAGWISVATIANVSAYLVKLGWTGGPLTETTWAVIMIVIATIVNLYMIWTRNMREFALVGIWALIAIFIRHQNELVSIAYPAIACAILLGVNVTIHGYKNRMTNPILKMQEGTV